MERVHVIPGNSIIFINNGLVCSAWGGGKYLLFR